jgi:hypothetical protein
MIFQATENGSDDELNFENIGERGRMSILMKQLNS